MYLIIYRFSLLASRNQQYKRQSQQWHTTGTSSDIMIIIIVIIIIIIIIITLFTLVKLQNKIYYKNQAQLQKAGLLHRTSKIAIKIYSTFGNKYFLFHKY